jgi:hypothetical protein
MLGAGGTLATAIDVLPLTVPPNSSVTVTLTV